MALVSVSVEGLKRKQEAGKGVLESKRLIVNFKKRIIINSGKARSDGKEETTVCRKFVNRNTIIFQPCNFWVHKRFSGIGGRLK